MRVKTITDGMPESCSYCNKTHDPDGGLIDLRPYGRDGAWICFDCGMKPDNKKTTEEIFASHLKSNDVFIVSERQDKAKLN